MSHSRRSPKGLPRLLACQFVPIQTARTECAIMKSPIFRNFARLAFGCAAGIAALTLSSNGLAQVRIEAEAYSGAPFGVGRVTIVSGSGIRVNGNLPIGNGR